MHLTTQKTSIGVGRGTIVLGVAASDAHVVANHLIAMFLRRQGFEVINLGACTPTEEFMRAASEADHLAAVLIGSLNGHAADDLADLPRLRAQYKVSAPIIVGGNLSVGAIKKVNIVETLRGLGVDEVFQHPRQIVEYLQHPRHHILQRELENA
ncbi:MAG: cobalamin B12-binding domain-containing protein [Ramlibacter sp.]|nr:cobalamin B12-binding domain-containing protein [Ramlibacter sp.]